MEIQKSLSSGVAGLPCEEELARINALAKGALLRDEVYAFSVVLCDNQVDRDCERFDTAALESLAGMFVGKTGIFDHQWSAAGQTARIYDAFVEKGGAESDVQEEYACLKAKAYMLRSEKNAELIAEIEAGIKKEVSVGVAVKKCLCSVCGEVYGECEHRKGLEYDGEICHALLLEPVDAYEWSFVAVPSQPGAGVTKGLGRAASAERELRLLRKDVRRLSAEAELGRKYMERLRSELRRAALLCGEEIPESLLQKMEAGELIALTADRQKRLDELYPAKPQVRSGSNGVRCNDDDFVV